MITGRRNFLRVASTALAGIAFDPLKAVTTNKDFYVNRALGLAFFKPKGWYFFGISEIGELKKKLTLAKKWEGIEQFVWESTGEPICVISKLDQTDLSNKGKFSPSITVWAESKKEFQAESFPSFEVFCTTIFTNRMDYVSDSRLIDRLKPYSIGNVTIREYHWEYTMKHEEMSGPVKCQAKMLFAEHGNYFYIIDFNDSSEMGQKADAEYEKFINDLVLM